MSIDWEELLGVSGEGLQDAYDALCDELWEDEPWDAIDTGEFDDIHQFTYQKVR